MTRLLLAVSALLLSICFTHAADPQPVWEIDTSTERIEPHGVNSVGFTMDGKKLIARVMLMQRSEREKGLAEAFERLVVWDIATSKEELLVELGPMSWPRSNPGYAVTSRGSVLVPLIVSNLECRLKDGGKKRYTSEQGKPSGVWYHDVSRKAVWIKSREDRDLDLIVSIGLLPPFEPNRATVSEKAKTARLTPNDVNELEDPVLRAVAVSPDLSKLALATAQSQEHSLSLFIIEHDEKVFKFTRVVSVPGAHRAPICCIQFSPDGKTLATGSGESSVFLWDVAKAGKEWRPRATIPTGQFTVQCLAYSPDGRTLAVGTTESHGRDNLFMIDVPSGKLISARRMQKSLRSIAYSPDGHTMATGDFLGKIRLWDAAAMRGD
jgi:WD40 repeat protein